MPADAVTLFGTDEPVPERRILTAGPLTAVLEDGNLRTICFHDVEAVRAVNYLARDGAWGTYRPEISNLRIEEQDDRFEVSYDALCAGPQGRFGYRMTVQGSADGRLVLSAAGKALTDFPTNRTGFVVLHPAEVAGGRLDVRHSDASVETTVFPPAISADQPVFDIAALTHDPAPGMACTVAMHGDAFEMEDQRNWADASFKTYVRPLSKLRPYVIGKGETDSQRIDISFTLEASFEKSVEAGSSTIPLEIGEPIGVMPSIGLFLDENPFDLNAAAKHLSAQSVQVRFDLRDEIVLDLLRAASRLASAIGAEIVVEGIFDCLDPAAEAQAFAGALTKAGIRPGAIQVAPRREFKTRPSNMLPTGEQPVDAVVDALRSVGVKMTIGAGTPSFFTEFNRNPPGPAADFVFFSIASNVHAADDRSIMETLSVYPAITESARRLCPGKPVWLGPCTIGMRHNPYGAAVAANPHGIRKPGAGFDPRQGAMFGAAFMAGIAAQSAGVERLVLAAPAGPFGLLDSVGKPKPSLAVHAALAKAAGSRRFAVHGAASRLAAIAYEQAGEPVLLLSNLTGEKLAVRLPEIFARSAAMDVTTGQASRHGFELTIAPYSVMLIS